VREVAQTSRRSARKLGLGNTTEIRLVGEFGTLLINPGQLGTAAMWGTDRVSRQHVEAMRQLVGVVGLESGENA